MATADARALLGTEARIGVSTHSVAEVTKIAAGSRVDYVHLAPIFDPLSKRAQRTALGPGAIAAAARAGAPVIAQGGITAANARAVCEAGAAGVAVTGAILLADDVAMATRALRRALDSPRVGKALGPQV
jgi:thiamine-phosphate pyrophosphorylase